MRPGSGSGSEEARGGLADGVAEGGVHSEGKKMNEALGSGTGHVSRHQGGAEKMHEEARCHRYQQGQRLCSPTHSQRWPWLETWALCAPNLTCDVTMFLLSRESGRAVLQQQLYYVQPRGGADDWGAGDRHGAEL